MCQYYDVYCLLENEDVLGFIGTAEYEAHKIRRFPAKDLAVPIPENDAFLLKDPEVRADFEKRYTSTKALYYKGQSDFDALLDKIGKHLDTL